MINGMPISAAAAVAVKSFGRIVALAALASVLLPVAPSAAQDSRRPDLPVVWVLSTGGTIAGTGASSTSLAEYKPGTLLGSDLVNAVPEIKQHANVKVEQIVNVASPDLTLGNWIALANRINRIFADDPRVGGIVITHGTNTLEETAYFLNLTVKHDRPVVLVGSQRPATAISADGPLNLLNAVRTASSSGGARQGRPGRHERRDQRREGRDQDQHVPRRGVSSA